MQRMRWGWYDDIYKAVCLWDTTIAETLDRQNQVHQNWGSFLNFERTRSKNLSQQWWRDEFEDLVQKRDYGRSGRRGGGKAKCLLLQVRWAAFLVSPRYHSHQEWVGWGEPILHRISSDRRSLHYAAPQPVRSVTTFTLDHPCYSIIASEGSLCKSFNLTLSKPQKYINCSTLFTCPSIPTSLHVLVFNCIDTASVVFLLFQCGIGQYTMIHLDYAIECYVICTMPGQYAMEPQWSCRIISQCAPLFSPVLRQVEFTLKSDPWRLNGDAPARWLRLIHVSETYLEMASQL